MYANVEAGQAMRNNIADVIDSTDVRDYRMYYPTKTSSPEGRPSISRQSLCGLATSPERRRGMTASGTTPVSLMVIPSWCGGCNPQRFISQGYCDYSANNHLECPDGQK